MKVDAYVCIHCGACASVCPLDVIEVSNSWVRLVGECSNCGLCAKICPMGAITVERKI